ncbi:MAG TPA: hypothetical protein PKN08_08145 [Opitutaceae bacterium]|nr:hypothetical protein [Opitutaceae bacterium]
MRLRRLTLQNYRNAALVQCAFEGRLQFFIGGNGQGKTNLLEAVGCLTALRSFRTSDNRHLIAHGQAEAAIACTVEHERFGETTVTVKLRADGKEVWTDHERVTRLADYLGRFPTVVFSSQDQQLIRGAPTGRRRWLDLTLAAMDAGYLKTLQTYHRALAERNALLKRGQAAPMRRRNWRHSNRRSRRRRPISAPVARKACGHSARRSLAPMRASPKRSSSSSRTNPTGSMEATRRRGACCSKRRVRAMPNFEQPCPDRIAMTSSVQ